MSPRTARRALVLAAAAGTIASWRGPANSPFWGQPALPSVDSRSPDGLLALAERARAAGALGDAITHARGAVGLAPMLAEARWELATLLTAKGELNEAFVHFDLALRFDPEPSAQHLSNLALALAWSGRLPDALARYRQALARQSDIAWVHENYAYALAASGDTDAARAELEEALRLDPASPGAREALDRLRAARAP